MVNLDYSYFQKKVLALTGIDLTQYKSEQMQRRLHTIMTRNGASSLSDYYRILSQDPKKLQEFRDFVTINVSEFFRIPEKFEQLRNTILPELMAQRRSLRIWSAGCSIGAEPYTLAIILNELYPFGRWQILATDIDATTLERAKAGVFQPADLNNVKPDLLRKYFTVTGNQYQVIDRVRSKVQYRVHDLLRQPYEDGFDLIVCRHVVIYFTEPAKDEVFRKFSGALRPGGVLFIGGTEVMRAPQELGFKSIGVSFYRKL